MAGEQISVKGLAWDWAQYISGLDFAQIPAAVIAKTKAVLLHNIAIAFAGLANEQGHAALRWLEPREDGVTVIGSRTRARPADAALVNSVLIRALRMEDVLLPAGTHPGATLVPAALAVGEAEGASGAEVLAALVAGYDVLGRAAGPLNTVHLVRRAPHHVFGPIATAAVAARLMRLDTEQTARTLCYAGNLATMIGLGFQDFQYGLITRNGILAAQLGRAGAPYAADALEGRAGFYEAQLRGARPSDAALLGQLGSRFDIMRAVIKPHPCTGSNLIVLELLHAAMRDHGLTNDTIRHINVSMSRMIENQANVTSKGPFDAALGGPPDGAFGRGMYVATSSLPFAIANVLIKGAVTQAALEYPDAPELVPVMAKIDMAYADFEELHAGLEIETVDGRRLRFEGGEDLIRVPDAATALGMAAAVIGRSKAERLQAAIESLDTAADLSAVTACLC